MRPWISFLTTGRPPTGTVGLRVVARSEPHRPVLCRTSAGPEARAFPAEIWVSPGAAPAAILAEKIFSAAGSDRAINLLRDPVRTKRALLFSQLSRLLRPESSFFRCGRLFRPREEDAQWQRYANC